MWVDATPTQQLPPPATTARDVVVSTSLGPTPERDPVVHEPAVLLPPAAPKMSFSANTLIQLSKYVPYPALVPSVPPARSSTGALPRTGC